MRETFLNWGRVMSILGLLWVTEQAGSESLPWVLAAASALQFGLVWSLKRPERSAPVKATHGRSEQA
ncbi:hypothetical protein LJK88_39195 [Paenibacillus sp. P26]|nr:hypothetical protein LJK88_39195 [Paenibacillus sp. P26]UUZ93079.1 hypothetical protein LJK87_49080 [Paenibacillus sp. P25]